MSAFLRAVLSRSIVVVALLASAGAQTGILFDQMTNNSQTALKSSWYPPDGSDADEYIYDSFLIPTNAAITEVWFVGSAFQNLFTVRFYNTFPYPANPDYSPLSQTAAPDETSADYIASYTFTDNGNQTPIPGSALYQHHVVLPSPLNLTGDTVFWIRIVSNSYFGWATATHGRNNLHLTYLAGLHNRLAYGSDMAFQLRGTAFPTTFCRGDGTGASCPCGNTGAAGNGCANSSFTSGASLSGSGVSTISGDTLLLSGSGMPNSSAMYFQGTSRVNAGAGSVFGDGLRCAAGSVIRLKTVFNTGGGSTYPELGDPTVSVRGLVTLSGERTYQIWYRNAASFCTVSTFNLSNGLDVIWVP